MADNAQISITCERCGKTFSVKPSRLKTGVPRFCSMGCRLFANDPSRFWAHVDKRGPDECWPWRGAGRWRGVLFDGEYFHAHSVAFPPDARPLARRWSAELRQSKLREPGACHRRGGGGMSGAVRQCGGYSVLLAGPCPRTRQGRWLAVQASGRLQRMRRLSQA